MLSPSAPLPSASLPDTAEIVRSGPGTETRSLPSAGSASNDLTTLQNLLAADPRDLDRLVRANPSAARRAGERELLAAWARAYLARNLAEADRTIACAEAVAAHLPQDSGRLLAQGVEVVRDAVSKGEAERLKRLAQGHRAFAEGVALHISEDDVGAREKLDAAILALQDAGSPIAESARMARLWAESSAAERIASLLKVANAHGFPALAAEALRRLGWDATVRGQLSEALKFYRESRDRFERVSEWEEAAVVRALRAELLAILGRRDEAAFELRPALRRAAEIADPMNRFNFWTLASSAALEAESPLAFPYRERAVAACAGLPRRSLCAVDSWIGFARRSGAPDLSDRAFERAEAEIGRLPDQGGRERTEIELAAARARWLAREGIPGRDPERAARLLAEVADRFEAISLPNPAALALDDQAAVLERLGRADEAKSVSLEALLLVLRWEGGGSDASREAALPGLLRRLYERRIRLDLAAGEEDARVALLLSDEMRDRLAPRLEAGFRRFDRSSLQGLLDQLSPRTAIVEYALIGGSGAGTVSMAMAWVLADGQVTRVPLAARAPLGENLQALRTVREKNFGLSGWKAASGAIYEDWVAPVRAVLPPGIERLILIPDSELYGVPWRGLWIEDAERYLDEELTVALAPSLASLRPPVPDEASAPPVRAVLSLGFSHFDDPRLADLPRAPDEAEQIATGSPGVSAPCEASNWSSFRRCAPAADVIHLATHATADSRLKGGSWIAFGAEKVDDERLWSELPALPRTRLVVLSACETATTASGEGLGGLARPFLAHGSRAVVGTLWNLGDQTALELFPAFHRIFAQTEDAAEALRRGRIDWNGWRRRPWKWAGAIALDTELR